MIIENNYPSPKEAAEDPGQAAPPGRAAAGSVLGQPEAALRPSRRLRVRLSEAAAAAAAGHGPGRRPRRLRLQVRVAESRVPGPAGLAWKPNTQSPVPRAAGDRRRTQAHGDRDATVAATSDGHHCGGMPPRRGDRRHDGQTRRHGTVRARPGPA